MTAAAALVAALSVLAGGARPPAALTASPARVTLGGPAAQTIRVANGGSAPLVVDVTVAGFALDLHGRPRIVARRLAAGAAPSWLAVRPRTLAIAAGESASLSVVAAIPPRAQPGDHVALLLLTTRPRSRGGISLRVRLGVVVDVRVPGAIVHRLRIGGIIVRRTKRMRLLELTLVNRGNVTEALDRGLVRVSLRRNGRVVGRLRPAARELLPRTRGVIELRYRGRVRGWVRAVVEVGSASRAGVAVARRALRLRL